MNRCSGPSFDNPEVINLDIIAVSRTCRVLPRRPQAPGSVGRYTATWPLHWNCWMLANYSFLMQAVVVSAPVRRHSRQRGAPRRATGAQACLICQNEALGNALTPAFAGAAHATEQFAIFELGGSDPFVDGRLNPGWHRHGANVPAFANHIDYRSVPPAAANVQSPDQPIPVFAVRNQARRPESRGPACL